MGNRYKEFLRHIFLEDDNEDMYLFDDHVKGAWRNAFQVKMKKKSHFNFVLIFFSLQGNCLNSRILRNDAERLDVFTDQFKSNRSDLYPIFDNITNTTTVWSRAEMVIKLNVLAMPDKANLTMKDRRGGGNYE